MSIKLLKITNELLPAFTPYLLPQAAAAVGSRGFLALGAAEGSETCAAIAASLENGELNIISLYVDKKVRRRGVGSMLLEALLEKAACPKVSASWILPEEEYLAAESFFVSKGFSPAERGDDIYRLSSKDFRKAPSLRAAFLAGYIPDGNIVPVSDFTDEEMAELLSDKTIPSFLRLDNFTPEELSAPTALGYRYLGRISAYFICSVSGQDSVALRAALSREGTPPAVFHLLTSAAIKQVISRLGEDFYVFISPVTTPALRLTKQLSDGKYELWLEGACQKPFTLQKRG